MAKLISLKKKTYPVNQAFRSYLKSYGRCAGFSLDYADLLRFSNSYVATDKDGHQTCWLVLSYPSWEQKEIFRALLSVYALLKAHGNLAIIEHLVVDRVELCLFGNSQPFRVRVMNTLNDNFDYFYVKKADASRLYGLELEQILSPNCIGFLLSQNTVVVEHIYGVPGDIFIKDHLSHKLNPVKLAKEFVKFNERCFVRLLGDMHSANFVVDISLDIDDTHYRIRSIDFDQQSYEGRKKVYLPQYYKENNAIVEIGMRELTHHSVQQYQLEERSLIKRRIRASQTRLDALLDVMEDDPIAPRKHIDQMRDELADHYQEKRFLDCQSMGALVRSSLEIMGGVY